MENQANDFMVSETSNAADATNNEDDQLSSEMIMEDEIENEQDSRPWSILSMAATMTPIVLYAFCSIASSGSSNENGAGAVWWLLIMYYWTLGIPLAIASIVFGIKGLKTNLRRLSIASLVLKAVIIIVIILAVLVH